IKQRLPSTGFRRYRQEFSNFFRLRPSPPSAWRADHGQRRTKTHRPPHPQKRGKLANSFFFRTQLPPATAVAATGEFANRGKLSGKVANSFLSDLRHALSGWARALLARFEVALFTG